MGVSLNLRSIQSQSCQRMEKKPYNQNQIKSINLLNMCGYINLRSSLISLKSFLVTKLSQKESRLAFFALGQF